MHMCACTSEMWCIIAHFYKSTNANICSIIIRPARTYRPTLVAGFEVLFQDQQLIIVAKPPYILVHPAGPTRTTAKRPKKRNPSGSIIAGAGGAGAGAGSMADEDDDQESTETMVCRPVMSHTDDSSAILRLPTYTCFSSHFSFTSFQC